MENRNIFQLKWAHVYFSIVAGYILLTCSYGYFGYLFSIGDRITGADCVGYYAYLRSIFHDGDINFTNEFAHFWGNHKGYISITQNGVPGNVFSIGPAILWSPFFVLAHLVTLFARFFGSEIPLDGYSFYYQSFVYIGNSLYGLLGIIFTSLILKRYLNPFPTLLSCMGIMFASQMTYYLWSFTAMAHNLSFATSALFFYFWLTRGVKPTTSICAALMFLSRWQNVLLMIPLLIFSIHELVQLLKEDKCKLRLWIKEHISFVFIFFICVSPQMAAWQYLYGSPILVPQGDGFIDFKDLSMIEVLFSSFHGLFSWHPLLILGLGGIILLFKRDESLLAASFLLVFFAQWILNAAVDDWWAGWSFGHRRFIAILPILALGLGLFIEQLRGKYQVCFFAILLSLAIWNQFFVYQYQYGLIPMERPLSFKEMVLDKFQISKAKELKRNVNKALMFLSQGDMKAFHHYSRIAYLIYPDHEHTRLIYGLACLSLNKQKEGIKVFREWVNLKPEDFMARWGLAELYVRKENYSEADKLFRYTDYHGEKLKIYQTIKNKINKRSKTLINETFTKLYDARLMSASY